MDQDKQGPVEQVDQVDQSDEATLAANARESFFGRVPLEKIYPPDWHEQDLGEDDWDNCHLNFDGQPVFNDEDDDDFED